MRYEVRVLPAAQADVHMCAEFIARDNLTAALRFYDAVERTWLGLANNPRRWSQYELEQPRLRELRKVSVDGFKNYLLFYHVVGDVVEVMRVVHGARDLPSVLADDLAKE